MRDALLHFSREPLTGAVHDVEQDAIPEMKPRGLWVSVGTAWPEWCIAEEYSCRSLAHVANITLAPSARILRVETCAALDQFTEQFGCAIVGPCEGRDNIAWRDVADRYDGIIIAPYHAARRFDPRWYYGWDVASGCIWRARAIESIAPALALVPTPQP